RDVLKVRVLAREPTGRGDRLIEGGMQATGVGIDERPKTFGIRRAQLLDLAVLEDLVDHRMRGAQLLEHGGIRRIARGSSPATRQLQLFEQERAELFRGVDRELVPDGVVRLALDPRDLARELLPERL